MNKKDENILIRVTAAEKEFIKTKCYELGYKTISAFLIESAQNSFKLEVDMSVYRNIAKEINYIGKNINNLVRKINIAGFYSDIDLNVIHENQQKILKIMNKEYDRLLDLEKKHSENELSLQDKKRLIEHLTKHDLDIPKKILLEEILEYLKDDLIYIYNIILNSRAKNDGLHDYLLDYMSGKTLFTLDDKLIVQFSDELFRYTQKLKFKLVNIEEDFNDDDWYELKDILDEYEVY